MIPAADPDVRKTGIGGSDAAAVLGVSRWKSPLQLYLEKTGQVDGQIEDNEAMIWGRILEPTVLAEYARRSSQVVTGRLEDGDIVAWTPAGKMVDPPADAVPLLGTLRHPLMTHMMCHLDAVATDSVTDEVTEIIEAKTSLSKYLPRDYWGEEGSDEVPEDYICQTMHQGAIVSAILGRDPAIVVPVLRAGPEWAVYKLQIDHEFTDMLIAREAEFWRRVETLDPPEPQSGESDKKALSSLFPQHQDIDPIEVAPDEDLHDVARRLNAYKVYVKDFAENAKECENVLKFKMGEHPSMVGPGWRVTWKTAKGRTKIDYAAAAKQLCDEYEIPEDRFIEVIEEHTHTGAGSRRFRFTWSEK